MRIRSVKPEFFLHDGLFELEQDTGLPLRVAFAGLWCASDREGRFKWKPRRLGAAILPYDGVDFARVLDALRTRGFVVKYACQGIEYGWIPSFKDHQVINNRESGSVLPDPAECEVIEDISTRARRVPDACPTPLVQVQGEGKGREGKGKEGKEIDDGLAKASTAAPFGASTVSGQVWSAYCAAYLQRYRVEPTRNAKVNSQIKAFVGRVPHDDAPAIAATYVRSNNRRYVAAGHSVGCLLQDAEKLRTELLTGRQGTAHAAAQVDKQSGRLDEYEEVFARLRAEDEADGDGHAKQA